MNKKIFSLITATLLVWGVSGCQSGNKKDKESSDKKEQKGKESSANVSVEKLWATPKDTLKTPESALYDKKRDVIYVSNINKRPKKHDGNGYISKVSTDGEVVEQKWVTDLDAPKGMGVHNGKLYVTNINELAVIDIKKGKVVNRYKVEGSQFLNDVTISDNGEVYFTDSDMSVIHVLKNDSVKAFKERGKLNGCNGLYWEKDRLMIASFKGESVKALDWDSKEISEIAHGVGSGDGIVPDGKGNYLVSNWHGQVYFVKEDGTTKKLLDTKSEGINAADIDYIQEKQQLLVPTFKDNRLMAYKVTY